MRKGQFTIEDNSGDKKYFTIVPNYILNHSTAIDQALYLQMKRIAGEGGKCKASASYFRKQLGIGKDRYNTSLDYLIEHKWITFSGKENIVTRGGVQQVNTYTVNDIWQINSKYYEQGGSETEHLNDKGVRIKTQGGGLKQRGGMRIKTHKEEPKEHTKNITTNVVTLSVTKEEKIELIELLKSEFGLSKLDGAGKWNFIYAGHLVKKSGGKKQAETIIKLAAQHPYWSKRITKMEDVWKNCIAITNDYKNKKQEVVEL